MNKKTFNTLKNSFKDAIKWIKTPKKDLKYVKIKPHSYHVYDKRNNDYLGDEDTFKVETNRKENK